MAYQSRSKSATQGKEETAQMDYTHTEAHQMAYDFSVYLHEKMKKFPHYEKFTLQKDIQESIEKLEDFSKDFTDLHFQIALNYGSRDEITRAVNRMLEDQKAGKLETPVSENTISGYLDTAGIPDPDLMIRTSGELRLSNYLLWQLAYSEFYFTDVPWPDFKKEELVKAIEKYNERDRRYGGVKEE